MKIEYKRVLSIFLVLCLTVTMMPSIALMGFASEDSIETQQIEKLKTPNVSVANIAETGKIVLLWDIVDKATGYIIFKAEKENGEYEPCTSTDSNKFVDNNVEPGKKYYYRICATGEVHGSNSDWAEISGICKFPQPTNLKITNISESGMPKLTWDPVPGIEYYYIYRATNEDGPYTCEMRSSVTGMYYENLATVGRTYYYKVEAVYLENEEANSAPTDVVSTTRDLKRPFVLRISNDATSGKPQISWESIYGADKYYVYKATSKDGEYLYQETVTEPYYLDTEAEAGKIYSYKVCAVYEANEEANSAQTHYSYIRCALPQPTNLKATTVAYSGKPQVSWPAVTNTDRYYVYRATSKDGTYSYLGSTTKAYYVDNTAKAGEIYYYKVEAVCDVSEKANSIQSDYIRTECALEQPMGLKTSNVSSSGKPQITWNPVEGADKYYVYRATSKNGTYTYLKASTTASYIDNSAVAGKGYYYKVRAVYSSNENANSVKSSCAFRRCDLEKPVSLKISNVSSSGKPQITWAKVDSADKYYVYRATTKNGKYSYINTTTKTTYVDTYAQASKVYYYKVRAVYSKNEDADSAQSSYVYTRCDLSQPKIKIELNSSKPKITWASVDGASSYVVYRKVGINGTYSKYYTTGYTSFTNTSAKSGTRYYYKVIAVSKVTTNANSAYSNEVSIVSK